MKYIYFKKIQKINESKSWFLEKINKMCNETHQVKKKKGPKFIKSEMKEEK